METRDLDLENLEVNDLTELLSILEGMDDALKEGENENEQEN